MADNVIKPDPSGLEMVANRLAKNKLARGFQNPLTVIRNNNPGFILVVGMMMGASIGFAGTYLRPMAESLEIEQIQLLFFVYNGVAFVSRLLFRRAPQVLGLRATILVGFGFMAVGILLFLPMRSESWLWIPALACGLGHSFLFPSVIAACTNKFPDNQRGVSSNLILAMYDAGILVGMPAIGAVLTVSRAKDFPEYPAAILFLFVSITAVSIAYWFVGRR